MPQDINAYDADIIILEADGKVDPNHGYGYLLKKRLQEFNINTSLFSLPKNADRLEQLPSKPLLISGGATEVTVNVDWIVKSKNFISNKIQHNFNSESKRHVPILGICFGAQLLAESYRQGSVTYSEEPEIGITCVKLETSSHPLFKGYRDQFFNAYTFHYNQIGVEDVFPLSVDSDHTMDFVEAFEIQGSSCFGLQFHPEFEYDEFIALLETNKENIAEIGYDLNPVIKGVKSIPNNAIILKNFYNYCQEL